jgi:DDB1- and CUL4-associated factor 13
MKVKMLCRNPNDYVRETKKDIFKSNITKFTFFIYVLIKNYYKVPRNYDPDLHPHQVPREYTRALNTTK